MKSRDPLLEHSRTYRGVHNLPITSIKLSATVSKSSSPPVKKPFKALWDTGSQTTFVTEKVVERLGLEPQGGFNVLGIRGETTVRPSYHVRLFLSNEIVIEKLSVAEFPDPGDFDVLIGMDVINRGNLMVDSLGRKTVLRFRTTKSHLAKPLRARRRQNPYFNSWHS